MHQPHYISYAISSILAVDRISDSRTCTIVIDIYICELVDLDYLEHYSYGACMNLG